MPKCILEVWSPRPVLKGSVRVQHLTWTLTSPWAVAWMEQELLSLDAQQVTHSFTCLSPAARAVNFSQLTLSWLTRVGCMYCLWSITLQYGPDRNTHCNALQNGYAYVTEQVWAHYVSTMCTVCKRYTDWNCTIRYHLWPLFSLVY